MTSRRLVLIRHSKAVAGEMDHGRPLSDRGLSDAAAAARWLAAAAVIPDRVVVSTSTRTRQTWDVISGELGVTPELVADHRIYVNTVGGLLAIVHETPDEVGTLALIGHNPSMGEFARGLDDGEGDEAASHAVARAFQTSGIACFDVPVPWSELAIGGARLTTFAVPRG